VAPLLLDRDRRRQPFDQVDVGFSIIEELPREAKAFDVAALPLGVERIEGERRLSGAGEPRVTISRCAADRVQILRLCVRAPRMRIDHYRVGSEITCTIRNSWYPRTS